MRTPEEIASLNPKGRFTERVEAYARARPGYPPALIDALAAECGLRAESRVADIGSGTGLLSRLLLERGAEVVGVEPNAAMRAAGERELAGFPKFRSIDGSAEATGLDSAGVDPIVAAQAFHWFDQAAARLEFRRILRPGGRVALIWNDRLTAGNPFLAAYETFLREYSTDYRRVNHREIKDEELRAFLGPGAVEYREFPNQQILDAQGLRDRVLSSSYMPGASDARQGPMLARLAEIFGEYQSDGVVAILYRTQLWHGSLGEAA